MRASSEDAALWHRRVRRVHRRVVQDEGVRRAALRAGRADPEGLAACEQPVRHERTGSLVWRRCGGHRVHDVVGAARLVASRRRRISLGLARARRRSSLGVLLTNPRWARRLGYRARADGRRLLPTARSTGSTSCRGIRAASAASAPVDCGDELDFFYAVDESHRAAAAASRRRVETFRATASGQRPAASVRVDRRRFGTWTRSAPRWACRRSTTSASRTAPTSARSTPTNTRARARDGARRRDRPGRLERRHDSTSGRFRSVARRVLRVVPRQQRLQVRARREPDHGVRRPDDIARRARRSRARSRESTGRSAPAKRTSASPWRSTGGPGGWNDLRHRAERRRAGDGSALLAVLRFVHGPASRRHLRQRDRGVLRDRLSRRPGAASSPTCKLRSRRACCAAVSARRRCGSACRARTGRSRRWASRPIHAPGAPPIVVIGTTDDPATPYAGAGTRERAAIRASPHLRGRGPHRVRPRRRLHRRRGRTTT